MNDYVFLPLGGSGEIGMNLNLYGFGPEHDRKWIIVDLGVTFGGPDTPGIDIVMPDTSFIEERRDDLLGIVLTHAHEDHMGALARLWPRLKCPVWATPFTMYLVKDRLAEAGLTDEVELHEVQLGSRFDIGPFDIELVTLTHSIPEPNALAIRTDLGLVLHTGDWKIDKTPTLGPPPDEQRLRELGDEGILAMVCDSTNVFSPGYSGSEDGVRDELVKLIGEYDGKAVAVATFASNVGRLESIMEAAKQNNRSVCLIGRSMKRMTGAAKSIGLLGEYTIVDEDMAAQLPQGHVLYLVTGSQGEPRAALSRIANGEHRSVRMGKGDVVIFSSKVIPGNEKAIFALQNALADEGIEIVTERDRDIHVSGHPNQDELREMYEWARPEIAIPVHGERRHLLRHAALAKEFGARAAMPGRNGEMMRIAPDGPEIIDIVPSGRLHLDGSDIVASHDEGLRLRKKMAYAGHVGVSLVVNKAGAIVSGPEPRISGFPEGEKGVLIEDLLDAVADEAEDAVDSLSRSARADEDAIEEKVRSRIKKLVRNRTGKRAIVEVTAHKV